VQFVVNPCAIAEIWMVGYLLVVGRKNARTVKTAAPEERILAMARTLAVSARTRDS
jgi:hypothetical protein